MPKSTPLVSNFGTGEMSGFFLGRVDAERYKTALQKCVNYLPMVQGGITRRPGTTFVAEVKDSSKQVRLQAFEFSTEQAYMIEFGHQYIRFYKDNAAITLTPQAITGITNANPAVLTYGGADTYAVGDDFFVEGVVGPIGLFVNNRTFRVASVNVGTNEITLDYLDGTNVDSTTWGAYTSGGTIAEVYTISSTYTESELFQLNFTQSADVLYIVHPEHAPAKLSRTGHAAWTLTDVVFSDGPYFPLNTGPFQITPTGTTGSITLNAGGAIFVSTDVGRLIRLNSGGGVFGVVRITAFTSTTQVDADVLENLGGVLATGVYYFGLFSETTGYPSSVIFHEDRLVYAGHPETPQRLDFSVVADYDNFNPASPAGITADDDGFFTTLNSNDVNATQWMTSDEKGLLVGTTAGEWVIKPAATQGALLPDNFSAKKTSAYGSQGITALQIGKSTLYVQRGGRRLRELMYFYDSDGFQSNDMTLIADHIAGEGFKTLCYQATPQSLLWAVRNDGVLASMTYERDIESLRAGWARHMLGGRGDTASGIPIVESASVIPSADLTRKELWVSVKRYIDGKTVRYVEYMGNIFDDLVEQKDAEHLDAGLKYDDLKVITNVTQANPAVVTSNAHGFSNGDRVLISGVAGMTELNGNDYEIAGVTANTFQLVGINSAGFGAYISGGEARKYVDEISGLWHLEGETVQVYADGAPQTEVTVSDGQVTLESEATTVRIGYAYDSDGQLPRLESGSATGTALGKTRRTNEVYLLTHRTRGMKIGYDFADLDDVEFYTPNDLGGRAPQVYTGMFKQTVVSNYDTENNFCWRQNTGLPGTVLAILPRMDTKD